MPVVWLKDRAVAYAVEVRPRRRHPAITIGGDGSLVVLLPAGGEQHDAERLMHRHQTWVLAHAQPLRSFSEGERFSVLGEDWPIAFVERPHRTAGVIELPVGADDPRAHLIAWYVTLGEGVFGERLAHFAPGLGVDYGPVWIRDFKSRWGYCHPNGRIGLNWRLMQAPRPVIDYVVVHELCHRRVPNHGPKFYRLVASVHREWESARRWLNTEGFRLYW